MTLDTRPAHDERTATRPGGTGAGWSLALAVTALVLSPLLLALPVVGFLPALVAVAGAAAGWVALRHDGAHRGLAVTGLTLSVLVGGLVLGLASLWTFWVVNPAITDYPELQEAVRRIWRR